MCEFYCSYLSASNNCGKNILFLLDTLTEYGYNRSITSGGDCMTFGQQIQQLRKEKGFSQDKLASMLYVTRQSVSQWENDKAMPSVDLLLKLSQIFGITVDRLLGKEAEPEAPFADGNIIKERTHIRKAMHYQYASTVTVLCASVIGIALINLLYFTLWPVAFEGISYRYTFTFNLLLHIVMAAVALMIIILLLKVRIINTKRAISIAEIFSEKIEFFGDHFTVYGSDNSPTSFFYVNLKRIFENDNYYIFMMQNKNVLCVDKRSVGENIEKLSNLLKICKNYRHKKLVIGHKRGISASASHKLIIICNSLFVFSIFSVVSFSLIKAHLLANYHLGLPVRWMIFLLPFAIPLSAAVLGIILTVKKIKAKRLIIVGMICLLSVSLITGYNYQFETYDFNLQEVTPEQFLATMESKGLTVEETNREHLDDYLWDCYTVKSDDESYEITYMHFMEHVHGDALVSATKAYGNFMLNEQLLAKNDYRDSYLNLIYNCFYTHKSANGRYCYISINKFTVIYISATEERMDTVSEILEDFKMPLPY